MRGPINPVPLRRRRIARADAPRQQTLTCPADESLVTRGTITVISGCMFSGKTTELLRRVAQHPSARVLAVKHLIDTRYSTTQIVSHAGKAYPATLIAETQDISMHLPNDAEIVAIDEAHFFDGSLANAALHLARQGIDVVLTLLAPDSWGNPFPVGERLRAIADEPIILYAICARCGARADRTQRLTPIVDGQMVGGPESSEPRCVSCWLPPPQPVPA